MASATSCFNSTLYKKTMARFWPLWALYALFWAFALPLNLLTQYFDRLNWGGSDPVGWLVRSAVEYPVTTLSLGVWMSAFFGLLSAMAAFGYLYTSRSACMMHALPLRREALFGSQYLAGLSFGLLPHLGVALLTLAAELLLVPSAVWRYALPALGTWLLVQSATFLFFFSFAAFCAMFTGHTLALPAFYGILNVLVVAVYDLITSLMSGFFYGYTGHGTEGPLVKYCTPVYALVEACDTNDIGVSATGWPFTVYTLSQPGTVAGYAAAGVVFALLALLVYRTRHVETAGDVVSVPLVKPLFRCGVAFCSGLFFGVFTAAFFGWGMETIHLTLCVVVWAVIGCFAAEMFLQKSFRVWKKWPWAAAMGAVMAVLCAACFLDLFGVAARVPQAADVTSLRLDLWTGYPRDSRNVVLDDPEDIQAFIDLHQAVVRDWKENGSQSGRNWDETMHLELEYYLKNGSVLHRRYYNVPLNQADEDREGSVTWQAGRLFQDPALLQRLYGLDSYDGLRLVDAWLDPVLPQNTKPAAGERIDAYTENLYLSGSLPALWQAVRQDFTEGNLGQIWLFNTPEVKENTYSTRLQLEFDLDPPPSAQGNATYPASSSFTVPLTPHARHTLAALEDMGALDGSYLFVQEDVNGNAFAVKPPLGG